MYYRIRNLVALLCLILSRKNDKCVQPGYCRKNAPEDYCNPSNCKDCDK